MFDTSRLDTILESYKKSFVSEQWPQEKYKWEAVKWFQDHWDVNATDFPEMLTRSLQKTSNLLASAGNFPASMIQNFAKAFPEEVRTMFINLFDESQDVVTRILDFKEQSETLLENYNRERLNHHYQSENAISTYLWLRYPDKYYIYKFSEIKRVIEELGSEEGIKRGAWETNLRTFYALYDEIRGVLQKDNELVNLLKSQLTADCYPDPELCTLTIDVGYYISRKFNTQEETPSTEEEWFPSDYSPGFTVDKWVELIRDEEIFDSSSLAVMKRFKDYGGKATCKQLSEKYGETPNFYNNVSVHLAKRIAKKTKCPMMPKDADNSQWWPILYIGKSTSDKVEGSYIWKLRDELSEALDKIDLSEVELYAAGPLIEMNENYWWLSTKPAIWSFSDIAVGETQSFSLYNERDNKRRIFQNFLDAKPGEKVIVYESNPIKQIVALAEVLEAQENNQVYFKKLEDLHIPIDYQVIKNSPELEDMEFNLNPNGTLFKLKESEYDFILDLIREENPYELKEEAVEYNKNDFLDEVFMSESAYDTLVTVIKNKKNIILQGPPGVGKTFTAKRLAYSIMGIEDDQCIEFVQFHQNYSYEDFMMGYKPVQDTFELKYGIFYHFCQKAANHPERDFYFIIDEINRGNMSKIFGELLMLIERDYRGTKATLAYNGQKFSVPENLYIIGMMNTADRSLAIIDYALRRRFSFFDMEPGFESEGFKRYQEKLESETFDHVITKVQELNKEIATDPSLGSGFRIGHSYFINQEDKDNNTDEWVRFIVEYDILPMLREYWFDDDDKLKSWESTLRGVFR